MEALYKTHIRTNKSDSFSISSVLSIDSSTLASGKDSSSIRVGTGEAGSREEPRPTA